MIAYEVDFCNGCGEEFDTSELDADGYCQECA